MIPDAPELLRNVTPIDIGITGVFLSGVIYSFISIKTGFEKSKDSFLKTAFGLLPITLYFSIFLVLIDT